MWGSDADARARRPVGAPGEVAAAYEQAWSRFRSILVELVGELPLLRAPVRRAEATVSGPVARRMYGAAATHRAAFVTPMAAVADEALAAMACGGIGTKRISAL